MIAERLAERGPGMPLFSATGILPFLGKVAGGWVTNMPCGTVCSLRQFSSLSAVQVGQTAKDFDLAVAISPTPNCDRLVREVAVSVMEQ
jgi:hypothetical protein